MTNNFTAFGETTTTVLSFLQQSETLTFQGGGDLGGYSFFLMFVQTIFALGLVCGLAYVLFRWVLPRLGGAQFGNHIVRIVDRVPLDARKNLYVVEVAGRWLLIASSEAGVHIVSELDAAAAEEAAGRIERERPTFKTATVAGRSAFADQLARLMSKKR